MTAPVLSGSCQDRHFGVLSDQGILPDVCLRSSSSLKVYHRMQTVKGVTRWAAEFLAGSSAIA